MMIMETVSSSEMSVSIYQTIQCYVPEDSDLRTCCRENLRQLTLKFTGA
jgi:hypothetical protein